MSRVLSQNLRERVVAAFDGEMPCRAAAERFEVSAASAIRWRQLVVQNGTPAAKPQGGNRRAARIDAHAVFILGAIEARTTSRWSSCRRWPSAARRLGSARCGGSSTGTGSPAKKTAHAIEQDGPDALKRREEWFDGRLDPDPERLVFIDESRA